MLHLIVATLFERGGHLRTVSRAAQLDVGGGDDAAVHCVVGVGGCLIQGVVYSNSWHDWVAMESVGIPKSSGAML